MDEDGRVTVGGGNGDLDRVMAVVRRLWLVCRWAWESAFLFTGAKLLLLFAVVVQKVKGLDRMETEGKMRRNGAFSIILKMVRWIRGASRG